MQLPEQMNITEQVIDISNITDEQSTYYHKLAEELEEKYTALGQGRQIFTLSGPPGSGKSVISAILGHLYSDNGSFNFANVGLDSFHFDNDTLVEKGLLNVKGRYDTYDTDKLHSKLSLFKSGDDVLLPYYSRKNHNPIEDYLEISNPNVLMLLEGQWLLRNTPSWKNLREFYSFNLEVSGPVEVLAENVIDRHVRGGRNIDEAKRIYTENDLVNTKEIADNSVACDQKILFYKDI